jgi:hypothetical protein
VFILKLFSKGGFVSTEDAADTLKLALNCLNAFHEGLEHGILKGEVSLYH